VQEHASEAETIIAAICGRKSPERGRLMAEPTEAREWHGIIRASVRECLETWQLQAKAGPVTVEALVYRQ
jgi:hypothetical protein